MPRTKTLKQLAGEFEVHPNTLVRWLRITFPHWYKVKAKDIAKVEHQRKRTYTPKEIKLIYDQYGQPNEQ